MAKKRKDKDKLKKAKKKISKKTENKKKKKSKKKQNKKQNKKLQDKKVKKNKQKSVSVKGNIATKEETSETEMSKLDTLKVGSAKKTVLATAMAKDDAAVVVKQETPESIKGESTTTNEDTTSAEQQELNEAFTQLGNAFITEHWPKLRSSGDTHPERAYQWPGKEDETIMICVFKGQHIEEAFHRHDFFFLNFAYQGDYGALSYTKDNYIKVKENECYIGQPYTGYALQGDSKEEIIIIGVLIQKETFFKTFFPILAADQKVFNFFLEPQNNEFSENFIHLHFQKPHYVRRLLELMVLEFATVQEDTQAILQSLVAALLLGVAREQKAQQQVTDGVNSSSLIDQIMQYISTHVASVSLKQMAADLAYHPNYISNLIRQETGQSFSEIVTAHRMDRAASLLRGTDLSVEMIAGMLGYSNTSNFYKAFKRHFNTSPRAYINS